jgi:hypothetical protein
VDSIAVDNLERNSADAEAQQTARDAIMAIPQFPELERRLISVLGPTSEALMIHQLVYWFSKPKMQNRWSAYKTYKEWKDERGLNRKQVDKGRKRLKANKLVEMKYSNYKRITYRVDWVRLAGLLQIPLKGGQSYDLDDFEDDDFDDLLGEPLYPLKGGQSSSDAPKGGTVENDIPLMDDAPDTYAENSSFGGVQSNARDYAGAFSQDNTLLQRAPEPAFAEPGAPEMNKKEGPQEDDLSSQPDIDKRHSQAAEPPKPKIAKEVEIKVWALIFGLPEETDVTRFADQHIADKMDADGEAFTVERVAEKAREHLGRDEPLEAYIPYVQRCLDDKRAEGMQVEAAS